MNSRRTILVVLISLVIAPVATAKIYKCDGPDGPVYTDWECGPDATKVEVLDTSGLGGITEETKAELARKKADREEARNRKDGGTVINNQYTTINTQPEGYWVGRPYLRKPHREPRPPAVVPTPLPSTVVFRRN